MAVALSGGPDSVALLLATAELKRQVGGRGELFALHVDHRLRGAESEADALWCAQFCDRLGIPLQQLTADVATRATVDGDGIEAAARAERYRVLTEAAELRGARYLFLGHTRDDQVETVLFRILRGTGLRGLAGIGASRPLTPSLTLLRPLLKCNRDEVLQYLDECGQDYRTDASNAQAMFTRNRLRTQLLPQLRAQYNLGLDDALVRLADQAAELQAYVETQAAQVLKAARGPAMVDGFALDVAALRGKPRALIGEVLRLAWREAGFSEQAMTRPWWNKLANLTTTDTSTRVLNLPGNVRAELVEGLLAVVR